MLRAMRIRGLCVVALCCLAIGCAYGNIRQVLRTQFAAELDCSEVQIKQRELWFIADGPPQFKLIGCGVTRTYTCPNSDGLVAYGDDKLCTWIEGDADAPKIMLSPMEASGDAVDPNDPALAPPPPEEPGDEGESEPAEPGKGDDSTFAPGDDLN